MTKLLTALKRTLNPPYTEPPVHFHAASTTTTPRSVTTATAARGRASLRSAVEL